MPEPSLELPAEGMLLAVSQLGLALGGFAGLLASFWPSQHSRALRRSPALRIILDFTFGALLFGLLPFALFFVSGSQILTWRACSLLLAGFLFYELIWWIWRILKGLRPVHPFLFYSAFVFVVGVVALLELVNCFSRAPFRGYAVGLLWLLVPPIIQFYLFIIHQDRYLSWVPEQVPIDGVTHSVDEAGEEVQNVRTSKLVEETANPGPQAGG